ncbi:MAG: Bro-N domain-containing protein [Oscillospiraceae bacterium]|nr:Bro-N domain-containing protein [Oscillospiraceae bacterium]
MMNTLQVFENPEFGSIRTVEIGGEPWLVGKDVAVALGYSNPRKALADHVDKEDKGVTKCDTPSGTQQMTIINESGLYSLILSSKLPGAKKFKRWVTVEVLPSIRKTGGYMAPGAENAPLTEKTAAELIAAVQLLTEQLAARPALPQALALDDPPEEGALVPGPAAKKRWMRTASEKLDLLAARKGQSHRALLHQIYRMLEKNWGISLEEERLRVMAEMNLTDCSVLAAIFYTDEIKDGFEDIVDQNLAPENRGW